MTDPERRRRRLRGGSTPAAGEPNAATPPISDPEPTPEPAPAPVRAGYGNDDRETERGLRGLVGSGASQVSVSAAMRARDAARPTDDDLAEAERHLTIVRRNWTPREASPYTR